MIEEIDWINVTFAFKMNEFWIRICDQIILNDRFAFGFLLTIQEFAKFQSTDIHR